MTNFEYKLILFILLACFLKCFFGQLNETKSINHMNNVLKNILIRFLVSFRVKFICENWRAFKIIFLIIH